jgi:hypothetical protein
LIQVAIDAGPVQELAESPREIGTSRGRSHLIVVLLARDWLCGKATGWMAKRRFGSWASRPERLDTFCCIRSGRFHANTKKKQKRAEEEKKQFNPP